MMCEADAVEVNIRFVSQKGIGRAGGPEQHVESLAMRERVHAPNKKMIGHDCTQCLCDKRSLFDNFWGKHYCICPARKKILEAPHDCGWRRRGHLEAFA